MKKHLLKLIVPVSIIFFACNGNADSMQGSDSTYASTTTTDTTSRENSEMATISSDAVPKDAAAFLHSASLSGNMEVNMAQVALKQATNDAVKNLAKTIADQHTELNNKLNDIAISKSMQSPIGVTSNLQSEMDNIISKKGVDFDRAYLQWVIKEHEKDIDEFKNASANLNDEQFKQFASVAIPIMQQHLDAARSIKF